MSISQSVAVEALNITALDIPSANHLPQLFDLTLPHFSDPFGNLSP
jgi:hypothetical protein